MRMLWSLAVLVVSTTAWLGAEEKKSSSPDPQKIVKRMVFVSNSDWKWGTGCIMDNDHIITAAHIDSARVYVNTFPVEVFRVDAMADIMVLKPKWELRLNKPSFTVAEVGETVYFTGYAKGVPTSFTAIVEDENGSVVNISKISIGGVYVNTIDQLGGTSGSCIYNGDGKVVGLMSRSYMKELRIVTVLVHSTLMKRMMGW